MDKERWASYLFNCFQGTHQGQVNAKEYTAHEHHAGDEETWQATTPGHLLADHLAQVSKGAVQDNPSQPRLLGSRQNGNDGAQ